MLVPVGRSSMSVRCKTVIVASWKVRIAMEICHYQWSQINDKFVNIIYVLLYRLLDASSQSPWIPCDCRL